MVERIENRTFSWLINLYRDMCACGRPVNINIDNIIEIAEIKVLKTAAEKESAECREAIKRVVKNFFEKVEKSY